MSRAHDILWPPLNVQMKYARDIRSLRGPENIFGRCFAIRLCILPCQFADLKKGALKEAR